MTVTSIPASVAPPAPPAHEGSNGAADRGSADTGFASMLAGIHDRAAANATEPASNPTKESPGESQQNSQSQKSQSEKTTIKKSETRKSESNPSETQKSANGRSRAERSASDPTKSAPTKPSSDPGDSTAATSTDSDTTTDPVTTALLAALAGNAPRTQVAETPPTAAAQAATAATAADAKATVAAADVLGASPATATATDAATAAAIAEAAAATTALPTPAPQPPNPTATATATATDKADTTTPATVGDTGAQAPAANPVATKPATAATAPAPASPIDAATQAALVAATAATATAGTTTAPTTPPVRAGAVPKSDAGDGALIAAAQAAVDRGPAPEAAAAVKAATAPTAPPPAPPAEQLAAVIRPLQRGADGTYQLTLEMHPAELGRVDMRVEMRDGVIHASIHTEHPQTAELVRNALDDLRSRLDADGVRSGQLTVDSQGAGSSGRDTQTSTRERLDDGLATTPEPSVVVAAPTQSSDSLLDVRI